MILYICRPNHRSSAVLFDFPVIFSCVYDISTFDKCPSLTLLALDVFVAYMFIEMERKINVVAPLRRCALNQCSHRAVCCYWFGSGFFPFSFADSVDVCFIHREILKQHFLFIDFSVLSISIVVVVYLHCVNFVTGRKNKKLFKRAPQTLGYFRSIESNF